MLKAQKPREFRKLVRCSLDVAVLEGPVDFLLRAAEVPEVPVQVTVYQWPETDEERTKMLEAKRG